MTAAGAFLFYAACYAAGSLAGSLVERYRGRYVGRHRAHRGHRVAVRLRG